MKAHTTRRAAAEHRMTQTWVQMLLSKTHFLLLLQPREEYLSMPLEVEHIDPQVKEHPRKEVGRRRQKNVHVACMAR